MSEYRVLETRIDGLEKEVDELKEEYREQRKIVSESIVILRENLTRLTTLMEKQEEQLVKQNKRLEQQDQVIHAIGNDVAYLRQSMDANQPMDNDADKIWYRDSLFQVGKILLIILVVLLSVTFGIKIDDILGFLG